MEKAPNTKFSVSTVIRYILLATTGLAGLFWTWFAIAESISEGYDITGILMHSITPGLLLLAVTLTAFRFPVIGGVLLIAAGIHFRYYFHVQTLAVYAALVFPPVLAGLWSLLTSIPVKPKFQISNEVNEDETKGAAD